MSLAQLTLRTLFCWCPPVPMAFAFFLPPLPWVSLNSKRRDFREFSGVCSKDFLSVRNVCLQGSALLHLFSSASGGSFSDDDDSVMH